MAFTVFAREDIKKGDRVVVTGGGARLHKGGAVPQDAVVATALENIASGTHGKVEELLKAK
jgi:hypothetical protein